MAGQSDITLFLVMFTLTLAQSWSYNFWNLIEVVYWNVAEVQFSPDSLNWWNMVYTFLAEAGLASGILNLQEVTRSCSGLQPAL